MLLPKLTTQDTGTEGRFVYHGTIDKGVDFLVNYVYKSKRKITIDEITASETMVDYAYESGHLIEVIKDIDATPLKAENS